MSPKHLAKAPRDEIYSFLQSFDNILFDCDGVILLGEDLIPGSQEAIELLKTKGKGMKLITNNCFRTENNWDRIFERSNLSFRNQDVIFPTKAVVNYLKKHNVDGKVFVIGPPGMKKQCELSGLDVYQYKPCGTMHEIEEIKSHVKDCKEIGAVVVDLDFNLTYAKLVKAAVALQRPEVHFIVCASDKTLPMGDNFKTIGSFFIGETLEMMTGRTPITLGKPSSLYNNIVQKSFHLRPERTLFVGDSLITDMLFATRSGYQKLLVLSGTTNYEDMMNCPDDFAPKYYLNSLGELNDLIN